MAKTLTVKSDIPDIKMKMAKLGQRMPLLIANIAKNHYLDGFRKGGGKTDSSLNGWAKRKKEEDQKKRGTRAILVNTSHLKSDIDIRRTTFSEIVIGTLDTGYASYLNEGTEHMEAREFLGDSKELMTKINSFVVNRYNREFK